MVLVAIIVIVGVALAISYFLSNREDAEIDQTINELGDISAAAQEWYRKPSELGGGNWSFTGFTMGAISQPESTEVAAFRVVSAKGDSLSLEATGSDFTVDVSVTPSSTGNCQVTKGKAAPAPIPTPTPTPTPTPKANSNSNASGG
jgi:hypothetical protein